MSNALCLLSFIAFFRFEMASSTLHVSSSDILACRIVPRINVPNKDLPHRCVDVVLCVESRVRVVGCHS